MNINELDRKHVIIHDLDSVISLLKLKSTSSSSFSSGSDIAVKKINEGEIGTTQVKHANNNGGGQKAHRRRAMETKSLQKQLENVDTVNDNDTSLSASRLQKLRN